MRFRDRSEAGRLLADRLLGFKDSRPIVLALPRGGVPVGFEIARALGAPLDVVLVRKIGHPLSPELAIGAIAEGALPELTAEGAAMVRSEEMNGYIAEETERATAEIERRLRLYRDGKPLPDLAGRTAIVVDDGIATGATMRAALHKARRRRPARLVLAAPTAAADALAELTPEADETVCLDQPGDFRAVGLYYDDFGQLDDRTVVELLRRAASSGA